MTILFSRDLVRIRVVHQSIHFSERIVERNRFKFESILLNTLYINYTAAIAQNCQSNEMNEILSIRNGKNGRNDLNQVIYKLRRQQYKDEEV